MTDTQRYPAQVFWSDEDQGYIAIAPDLAGSSAFGETQQEALAELQHAIASWIQAAQSAGNVVPPPSTPSTPHYSGRFPLRMAKSLHAQLARQAELEGVSLNTYMNVLLTREHERRSARYGDGIQLLDTTEHFLRRRWREISTASTSEPAAPWTRQIILASFSQQDEVRQAKPVGVKHG